MKLRFAITVFMILGILWACNSPEAETENIQAGVHKVVVEEVLQTSRYTYLRVMEDGNEKWLAVPGMEAEKGQTYYYTEGMPMMEFESKELKRTFDEVLFLNGVSKNPEGNTNTLVQEKVVEQHTGKPQLEKKTVEVEHAEGGITIAELFADKEKYLDKKVKIRGLVTKYNEAIMNKNWVHLQDGTDHEGSFDLTVTTEYPVVVGDTIIIEGKVALNKDFGYGYKYDVIVEEAVVVK